MNKLTQFLIEKCVSICNKPDGSISGLKINITNVRFKDYHHASTSVRMATHEQLEAYQTQIDGFSVSYQSRGFDEVPILQTIEIGDGDAFLSAFGVTTLSDEIALAIESIESALSGAPRWISSALEALPQLWRQRKNICGFSYTQADAIICAIKLLSWAEAQKQLHVDYRTASVKALGESKLLERHLGSIQRVCQLKDPEQYQNVDSPLEDWGISKYAPLIRIRGSCLLQIQQNVIDISCFAPYMAIPMDNLNTIQSTQTPPYVLIIENLSSFERYCRQIFDGGIVVYSGGFPSRHWVRVLRTLVKSLAVQVPVFHWGDIDLGGYRILVYLAHSLSIDLIPFRMIDINPTGAAKSVSLEDLVSALSGAKTEALLKLKKQIEAKIANGAVQMWVEQESLDPVSPI